MDLKDPLVIAGTCIGPQAIGPQTFCPQAYFGPQAIDPQTFCPQALLLARRPIARRRWARRPTISLAGVWPAGLSRPQALGNVLFTELLTRWGMILFLLMILNHTRTRLVVPKRHQQGAKQSGCRFERKRHLHRAMAACSCWHET